jgi:hypothetical protein
MLEERLQKCPVIWGNNICKPERRCEVKRIVSLALLVIVLAVPRLGPAYGDSPDADGNTNASPSDTTREPITVEPLTSPGSTASVLMDYSHGVLFESYPETKYTELIALLEAQGYTVVASNAGILNLDLNNYGVIVLNTLWSASSPYSPAEVSALQDWVANGGGLLIAGEAKGCGGCSEANSNLNQVATALAGITLGLSTISPTELDFSNFVSHEIFVGVSTLFYRYAGGLGVVPPGASLAYTDSSSHVLVAGAGNIIALGDTAPLKDGDLGEADNQLFMENVFGWLAGAEPVDGISVFLPVMLSNLGPPTPPQSAPVLDEISNPGGDYNYTVSWSAVDRATSYTLEEDDNETFSSPATAYSGPDTSAAVSVGDVGTYYYRVKASNAYGESDWSNIESVVVTVPQPTCPQTGSWPGTTSHGTTISFDVSNDPECRVQSLEIWYQANCQYGSALRFETHGSALITNNHFSKNGIIGDFTSPTEASGTFYRTFFDIFLGDCTGSGTWTANYSP